MIVDVTTGNIGEDMVTVEWNDTGQPCRIRGVKFGEFAVEEKVLRSLYDALDFLYGRHRAE